MRTNRQIFWDNRTAPAARLGCIGGIHGNDLDTSFFRFVFKVLPKQSKPGVVGSAGKMSVTVHKGEGEVLDRNQVKLTDDGIGSFVKEVAALTGYPFMKRSDLGVSFPQAGTTPDLTSCVTLKSAKFGKICLQRAGIVNQYTGGKGSQGFQSHVNSNHLFCGDARLDRIGQLYHQAGEPALIDLLDNHMLNLRLDGNRSVIAHSHLTDILDIEAHPSIIVLPQLASVAIRIFDAFETAAALEPGKAGGVSGLDSAEERGKGFIEATKRLLETGSIDSSKCIRVLAAQVSKMRTLGPVVNPLARFLIGGNSLLKSGIICQPGLPKQKIQMFQLLSVWAKEVLVSTEHHLTRLLHFNVPLDGFFGNMTYRADVVTPAPQARQSGAKLWELLAQQSRGVAFELVGKALRCFGWVAFDKQMNVVWHDFECLNRNVQLLGLLVQQGAQFFRNLPCENFATILWTPNQVIFQGENASCIAPIPCVAHRASISHNSLSVNYLTKERRERASSAA